ncbi:helix-turn-helix transcriptional regulator [Algibacter sp.]|uniref:helix-turn-helix transcriptional regulator n=1 Tax=Algibacter sp. TaxID=1872428 RepID=UPI003C786CC4
MTAINNLLRTIKAIKQKGELLSEEDVLRVLKATKSISKNKTTINFYISLIKRIDRKKLERIKTLTKRELQVLVHIGSNESSASIAEKLALKISTIETHRKNIRKKLDLVGKGKLIEYAIITNLRHFDRK